MKDFVEKGGKWSCSDMFELYLDYPHRMIPLRRIYDFEPHLYKYKIPKEGKAGGFRCAKAGICHSSDIPTFLRKLIFDLSKEYGVPVEAVEFVNEPNMLQNTGFPKDYTAADFRRDQDIFHKWVRENYPECIIVGPSDTDPNAMSVDADGNPHPWASTYLEVPRTLNEIGHFATMTNGVIFHNTLASSDYGWLKHGTFVPRPSYFAVLLWKKLMGDTVYASGEEIRPGAHVFAHSRKDGKDGVAYLVINTSWDETTTVDLPKAAEVYALTGNGKMRSRTMLLNGKELVLSENDEIPALEGVTMEGTVEVAPGGCTFFVL